MQNCGDSGAVTPATGPLRDGSLNGPPTGLHALLTYVRWCRGTKGFVGPKPPLKPKQVWAIWIHLQREQRVRDLAMFDLAIDSKLRGCGLVKLKIGQVVVNAAVRHRATIASFAFTTGCQLTHMTGLAAARHTPKSARAGMSRSMGAYPP